MVLVLTMAGRYTRFTDAGYTLPKYLLPWGSRSILWEVIHTLTHGHHFEDVFLVGNVRDRDYMPHVREIMRGYAIPVSNLILTEDTSGQAETGYIALEHLHDSSCPVVFSSVDTLLYRRDFYAMSQALKYSLGYIDVFESHHKEYSYVMVDSHHQVQEIAEKVLISDLATSGLYGFASSRIYRQYIGEAVYISEVYKNMIGKGGSVVIGEKHREEETIVLGTPDEYRAASQRLG